MKINPKKLYTHEELKNLGYPLRYEFGRVTVLIGTNRILFEPEENGYRYSMKYDLSAKRKFIPRQLPPEPVSPRALELAEQYNLSEKETKTLSRALRFGPILTSELSVDQMCREMADMIGRREPYSKGYVSTFRGILEKVGLR